MVTGWLPYWNMSAAMASVTSNAKVFTDVSPFWYSASGSAPSIHITSQASGIDVSAIVKRLHSLNIQVIPTVTDGTRWMQMSTQLANSADRAAMVNRLVNLVVANNYDGIDLDWEQFAFNDGSSTWNTTRPRWIAFVRALSASLHARGKVLSVTAPAGLQTQSDSTGYYVYAWGAIGPYVDRLRVMAYDYAVSSAGPIAPMYWVDPVVAHAVTQVDPAKIQIGVPSYGRDWLTSLTGLCPNKAPVGASSSQSSSLFSKLDWASRRHEFDARYSSSFISNLFVDAAATIPGISLVKKAVSTWDDTAKERTYTYQVGFSGRYQKATVNATAVGGIATGNAIGVPSTSGFVVGTHLSGTGIASGATVTGLRTNALLVSPRNTSTVTGTITGTTSVSTTATGEAKATTITVASATGVSIGANVTGTSIGTNAIVTAITGNVITLSVPTTAAVATMVTFTTKKLTTAVGGAKGLNTVVVNSTSGITTGATAKGSGFANGTTVTAVSGHTVTLSKANPASISGAVSFTPAPVSTTCTASRRGWYAEAQAANATAKLVNKYHLGGIAQWTIGGEDTAQWNGITTFAKQIAAVPSMVTVTAPIQTSAGQTARVNGSVTFKSAPLASARLAIEVREAGTQTWKSAVTAQTDTSGNFTATIPAQATSYSWRATAVGDGWGRIDTTVSGAIDVPSPLVLLSTAPKATLTAQAVATSATVQFHHAPVAGVLVSALMKRSGSTAWTTVDQARTGADGKVALTIPGQLADFTWKLTVPGNGKLQLPSSAAGSIGIASRPLVRATAKLVLTQSTSNNVSGSIAFRGAPVAAELSVQIKTAGSATWTNVTSIKANAQGSFTAVIPAQRANYSWRVVAPTDGFTRLSTSVAGATQVQLGVAAHVVTKTATLGIPSIPTGSKPTFVGASNPRLPAFTVVLRHWAAGVWKVVATSTTNAKGTFTLTGVAQVRGTARYQVLVNPSATQPNVRGYTGVLQVTNS
jgi:spore germination protein YaaH